MWLDYLHWAVHLPNCDVWVDDKIIFSDKRAVFNVITVVRDLLRVKKRHQLSVYSTRTTSVIRMLLHKLWKVHFLSSWKTMLVLSFFTFVNVSNTRIIYAFWLFPTKITNCYSLVKVFNSFLVYFFVVIFTCGHFHRFSLWYAKHLQL